jgi:hypothetical protein
MTEEDVQMPDRCERAGGQLVAAGATDRWFENPTWGCRRITVVAHTASPTLAEHGVAAPQPGRH